MPRSPSKALAYGRLLRLPNLFTAVADPLAGWLVVGGGQPSWQLLLLVGAAGCLYSSGIVFNDCFDCELDRRERPGRPLPSGLIARATAWRLAAALMIAGLILAAAAGRWALGIGLFLAVTIFFYSAWAKRFWLLGPLALGACRSANFLLGMRAAPVRWWWMPGVVGGYVMVLSLIARREGTNIALRQIVTRLLLGIIVVDAALVAGQGDWVGAALVLSLLVPAVALSRIMAMT